RDGAASAGGGADQVRDVGQHAVPLDEGAPVGGEHRADPDQGRLVRVPAVEHADADGDHDVERSLAVGEREVLERDQPVVDAATLADRDRVGARRAVDGDDLAAAAHELAGERTGAAADLEHAQTGAQRQRVGDRAQPWREPGHREPSGPTTSKDATTKSPLRSALVRRRSNAPPMSGRPDPRVTGAIDTITWSSIPAAANAAARSPPPIIHTSLSPAAASIAARCAAGSPWIIVTVSVTGARSRWVKTNVGCV